MGSQFRGSLAAELVISHIDTSIEEKFLAVRRFFLISPTWSTPPWLPGRDEFRR